MTKQEMERMDAQFSEVKAAIQRVDDSIRGNGGTGLVVRVDRLERSRAMHNKALWLVLVGGIGVIVQWARSFWA